MSFTACLLVMMGGALGTLARYAFSILAMPIDRELPFGTIIVNVTGSFVIGLFATLTMTQGRFPVSDNTRLFVMVGLCGGYTTFSSFSLQTLELLREGALGRAAVNVVASVLLCVFTVAMGHLIAAWINGPRIL